MAKRGLKLFCLAILPGRTKTGCDPGHSDVCVTLAHPKYGVEPDEYLRGCVYLSFLGGGSPLLYDAIKEAVAWDDLVSHYRLVKLRVEQLGPLVVGIDAKGNSTFETLSPQASERVPEILRGLDEARGKATGS